MQFKRFSDMPLGLIVYTVAIAGTALGLIGVGLVPALSPDSAISAESAVFLRFLTYVLAAAIGLFLFLLAVDRNGRLITDKIAIACLPLLALIFFVAMKWFTGLSNPLYIRLVEEDSIVEYAGALLLFAGTAFSAASALSASRKRLYLLTTGFVLLAAFMLWMGLEEISYGQRLLGFDTPGQLTEANYQGEANLHNIGSLSWLMDVLGPSLINAWGLFGWIVRATFDAIPEWKRQRLALLFPPLFLAPYFLPYALWANIDVCCETFPLTIWQDQEPAEAFLELAFFLFAAHAFLRLRHSDTGGTRHENGLQSA